MGVGVCGCVGVATAVLGRALSRTSSLCLWTHGALMLDVALSYGYIGVMNQANISYTRNHLSEMLARVRNGESILIVDRQHPVARLEPVSGPSVRDDASWQADLVRRGLLRTARTPLDAKALSALPLPGSEPDGDILDALLADREEAR